MAGDPDRIEIPLDRTVLCDMCNGDWTDQPDSGGLIFQSKAVCPDCTPGILKLAENFRETHLVRARCPTGKSFADFVRAYRGPDAKITITSI